MRLPLLGVLGALALEAGGADTMRLFIGTYTGGTSKGIYSYELNLKDGSLRQVALATETPNPSFLAIHPNGRFLYAVSEIGNYQGEKAGAVASFRIEDNGERLTRINAVSSGGGAPCHLTIDDAGRYVLVANYTGGNVAVLPVNDNGELGDATTLLQHAGSSVNQQRQRGPHAHSINLDARNRFAVAADLGIDKLVVYRFHADQGVTGDPSFVQISPGSGPRHFAFHPNGRNAYVINELLSTVTAFSYSADDGSLSEVQTISTLPAGPVPGNSTAEIQVHPSGRFVYGSNRGHDSIVVYAVDPSGKLQHVENESTRGKTPRNFGIDPTGKFLIAANQDSDTLAVFKIDPQRGELEPIGEPVPAPRPVCVKFLPVGR